MNIAPESGAGRRGGMQYASFLEKRETGHALAVWKRKRNAVPSGEDPGRPCSPIETRKRRTRKT